MGLFGFFIVYILLLRMFGPSPVVRHLSVVAHLMRVYLHLSVALVVHRVHAWWLHGCLLRVHLRRWRHLLSIRHRRLLLLHVAPTLRYHLHLLQAGEVVHQVASGHSARLRRHAVTGCMSRAVHIRLNFGYYKHELYVKC